MRSARLLFAVALPTQVPLEWQAQTDAEGRVHTDRLPSDLLCLGFVEQNGRFVRFYSGQPGAAELGRLVVASESLEGRVLSAGNAPLPGARVSLVSRWTASTDVFRTTYTDRVGCFRFEGRLKDEAGGRPTTRASH